MSLDIIRISVQSGSAVFEEVWNIYVNAFPEEERRFRNAHEEIMNLSPYYHCEGLFYGDTLIGIFFWWNFPEIRFIEHFATHPDFRNKGIGKVVMNDFIPEKETPIILEVEPPENKINRRRINFYQRLGFQINNVAYSQAPYRIGEPFTSLLLASYPALLTDKLYSHFVVNCLPKIYTEHYNSIK